MNVPFVAWHLSSEFSRQPARSAHVKTGLGTTTRQISTPPPPSQGNVVCNPVSQLTVTEVDHFVLVRVQSLLMPNVLFSMDAHVMSCTSEFCPQLPGSSPAGHTLSEQSYPE